MQKELLSRHPDSYREDVEAVTPKARPPLIQNIMNVYILFSEKSSRYYVGQTADINKRLERHNSCRVPSTKFGVPWKLIKLFEVKDRSEAMKLEHKIKKRGATRYLDDNLFGV